MKKIAQNIQNRIEINPRVMVGKPVIKGTRITVQLILRQLAQGVPAKEILTNYPHLAKEDILAAIAYAANLVEEELVYPLNHKEHAQASAR